MFDAPLILKFGGGVLITPNSFNLVSEEIERRKKESSKIVVVVSAMRGVTDHLISLGRQVHDAPPKRELDMLVSVGERVSSALLAMALSKRGIASVSFTGSQSGIITTKEHGEAKIIDVRPLRLLPYLERGTVVIVAGFQGVSIEKEITTLGRGGSDVTAVALAVALGGRMEFYKDVPGIYSRSSLEGQPLLELSHEEAIDVIERTGGKVLHTRAVRLAEKNHLPLVVRSLKQKLGTHIIARQKQQELPTYEASETETLVNV